MLKNVSKIFLIELFEHAVEAREKMPHKRDVDEEVLEEAYRKLKKR